MHGRWNARRTQSLVDASALMCGGRVIGFDRLRNIKSWPVQFRRTSMVFEPEVENVNRESPS
jgi:hypothetical protein